MNSAPFPTHFHALGERELWYLIKGKINYWTLLYWLGPGGLIFRELQGLQSRLPFFAWGVFFKIAVQYLIWLIYLRFYNANVQLIHFQTIVNTHLSPRFERVMFMYYIHYIYCRIQFNWEEWKMIFYFVILTISDSHTLYRTHGTKVTCRRFLLMNVVTEIALCAWDENACRARLGLKNGGNQCWIVEHCNMLGIMNRENFYLWVKLLKHWHLPL